MRQVLTIAGKEIRDGLRNRWILATTLLLVALALSLALLGSTPVGAVRASSLSATIVSLASLSIFLVPLVALLLAHDAIIGEVERGTMALLLAYPVARWQILLGKFLGHAAILSIAVGVGYGAAAAAIAASTPDVDLQDFLAFGDMVGTSILLGAVFVSIGYLFSAIARERAMAAGIAIAVWLLFVVVYDLALLGLLVADHGRTITVGTLDGLLLLNPADIYRLFNLAGLSAVHSFGGMAGLAQDAQLSTPVLLLALIGWIVVPLAAAAICFERKQI